MNYFYVDILNKNQYVIVITYYANYFTINYEHFQHPIIYIISFIKFINIKYNNKYNVEMLKTQPPLSILLYSSSLFII